MPTFDRYDFYSEPVQEIMGAMPSWLIRWGVTVIAGVLLLLVIGCCIVKYPETVIAPVTLTSERPPSDLKARYSGLLDSVCVTNGQEVKVGDLIALLRTPANYSDIMTLECILDGNLERKDTLCIVEKQQTFWRDSYELGDLNEAWLELAEAYSDYDNYMTLDYIGVQKMLVSEQIIRNKEYYSELLVQMSVLDEELKYEEKSLKRDSVLLARGVISDAEYENSMKNWMSKKGVLSGFYATLAATRLNFIQMEQRLSELELQKTQELSVYIRTIERLKRQFLAQVASWKEQYAIIAPSDGKVSMQNYWSAGQYVEVGETIASVVPNDIQTVIGRLKVPSAGLGKVQIGQSVNVKLNGFPYMEFGILKGYVFSISSVPEKTIDGMIYTANIHFCHGLTSSYGKNFPMVQQMDGIAEIITEDRRLIEVFWDPVLSLFKNQ